MTSSTQRLREAARAGHGADDQDGRQHGRSRALKHEEKVDLALLALPTFALALSITIVSTQLGEVTRHYTHQTMLIGAIVGGEGVMALWVPLIFGSWSDTLRTRIGGRLPFVLAGGIPAAAVLSLIGLVHGLGLIALVTALFFFFYFVAYEPYRAMYPDMLPAKEVGGRAQSAQAVARGLGTGLALLGGGLLLSVARPLPFAVGGLVLAGGLAGFVALIVRRGLPDQHQEHTQRPAQVARCLPRLVKQHPALKAYFFANALWETTLSAMKAFIVLYLTLGLGYNLRTASVVIGGVALLVLIGAAGSGKLGDMFGRIRVVGIALVAYGAGYLVPFFTTSRVAIGASVPFIALGGGTVMTMAYALLMPLMPEDEHGALTGFYSISRGVGIILGPVSAGGLIWATHGGIFKGTDGFQAMWIVCAGAAFCSLFFLRRMANAAEDRRQLEGNQSGGAR